MWIEELIEIAETSASSPVFPLLKRADERHVTMRAHDHPVFVEDMARNVALALQRGRRGSPGSPWKQPTRRASTITRPSPVSNHPTP